MTSLLKQREVDQQPVSTNLISGERQVQPLRVLQLISSLEVGGAEVMLLALLKASKALKNIEMVTVVLNDVLHEGMEKEVAALKLPSHFFYRKPSDKHPRHILKLLSLVTRYDIQVIHAHDPGSKMAALICKLFRPQLKVVFTVHDTHIIDQLNPKQLWLHKLFIDGHIAISQAVESECREFGIKRVRTLYNGVDLSRFYRKTKAEGSETRPLRLVQVARFELEKKGQDILLHALRRCLDQGYNVECSLVGMVNPSMEEQFQELKRLIDQLQLTQHVNLLINRTDIPDILVEHDVFVLPSRKEGFGLVIIEAMAAGLPVIASNLDGPAELVQSGQNGLLFAPCSSEDLADQIIKILKHPEQANSMVQEGFKTAEQYSIEAMAASYRQYYQHVLTQ